MIILIYLLTGVCAGLLSGLLGLGGGIIVIPALVWTFSHSDFPSTISMQLAAGTSLAAMMFTSTASVISHYKKTRIIWPIVSCLAISTSLGVIMGGNIAGYLPTHMVKMIFGLFTLFIAYRIAISVKKTTTSYPLSTKKIALTGFGIGTLSGVLGIGGGSLMIPFLTRNQVPMQSAAAISTAVAVPLSIIGSITFTLVGWHTTQSYPWCTGYIYWPATLLIALGSSLTAPLGVYFLHRLPTQLLKRIFAIFLLLVSIDMLRG